MRITKNQLKQLIKEELTAALNESPLEEQSKYGDFVAKERGGHGGDPSLHKVSGTGTGRMTTDVKSGEDPSSEQAFTEKGEVVGSDSTFRQRLASQVKGGEASTESSMVDIGAGGERGEQHARTSGDVSHLSTKVTPAGGSRAKPSRKDPLGLGTKPGAHSSETLTVGGVELKPGDEGYFDAFEKVGMPGLPEAGETGEERHFVKSADVSELNEQEAAPPSKFSSRTKSRSEVGSGGSSRSFSQKLKDVDKDRTVDKRTAVSKKGGGPWKQEKTLNIAPKSGGSTSLAQRNLGSKKSLEMSTPRKKTNQPIQLPGQKKSLDISSGGKKLKVGDEGYFGAQEELGYPGLYDAGESKQSRQFVQDPDVSEFETAKAMKETLERWKELIK